MLGYGRLCKRQFLDDIPANAGGSTYQETEDLDSRRIPDGLGERRQLPVGADALDGTQVRVLFGRRATTLGRLDLGFHRNVTIAQEGRSFNLAQTSPHAIFTGMPSRITPMTILTWGPFNLSVMNHEPSTAPAAAAVAGHPSSG